ncbi:MAG: GIY-YIG nuclease family protein [Ignavibacteriota bacterium]|nr:GIY-YIG nuclease family protein [Ignavibacteriota bacterium]MCO6448898.1 GIY-YIG nuclease family protein [Ignavibacterium album]MCZ2267852.1 GIY-YIG nuclease family protein [Ignavibacteriales bacterium]QKK00947.1 MAG: GIY-YIG nuclease family protein [Ignavibacteriota bacterium]HOJ07764.1 GIY-YIG nuclease family protein [Ignavibacteriaceae bacterium]
MDKKFNSYIDKLPSLLNELLLMPPVKPTILPKGLPLRGIYLFTEEDIHLYVGRSNNIKRRIQYHCRLSSDHNKATFAFRIARSETNLERATYKTEGSRKQLEDNPIFGPVFIKAKERIRVMELRFIEVNDPVQQALLEIYIAITLNTPFNDFENH